MLNLLQYFNMNHIFPETIALFTKTETLAIKNRIITRISKKTGKLTYFVNCIIRNKEIQLKPEEVIRQLYAQKLIEEYGYSKTQIQFEYTVNFGREKKYADIVIFKENQPLTPYIIVELKKAKLKDGKDQLKSYTNATGAPIAVWTNGEQISYYHRKDPNYFEAIDNIPKNFETLEDILNERWTLSDLVEKDILTKGKKSLKELILELEDEVLANAGVDVFEELFKLIFSKLYDEMLGGRDKNYFLQFRNTGQTDIDLKEKLEILFGNAKNKWNGVFSDDSKITLTPSHLAICVSALQNAKLFNSNLDVVDEAFEYLINKSSKGEKGQYFTPRYVIDMCVKMLNPQKEETMIDTASGSCGFPVHTIFHVWEQILKEKGIQKSNLFTAEEKPIECSQYVQDKVFAIDFDEKAVRVARTLNLIAGDGQTNVLHLNTLDFSRWDNQTGEDRWRDNYSEGWRRIRKLQNDKKSYQHFNFNILMANPPFAGDIKEGQILAQYELGKNAKGKHQTKVGRDILFIERNISFLKPGGRMAIVLPQGRFNNSSDAYIRNFLTERGRILAVVGLHGNVFKPHTGTKTSVLLWQKWTDQNGINPRKEDYPIFFATMQKPSKDNSGEKIYLKNADGTNVLDKHGHLIIDHDLFNHEGLTGDGIAEAFIEFAKREKLSFFFRDIIPFDEKRYSKFLKKLEISEVKLSETLKNKDARLDSQFWANITPKNSSLYYKKIGEILERSQYGISIVMNEENKGYPIYRMNEIHNMLCDNQVAKCADITQEEALQFILKNCDVLYIRTNGSKEFIGKSGIFYEKQNNNKIHIFASYLVKLIPNQQFILPEYLTVFLNSSYTRKKILLCARQSNQINLNPEELKEIEIPILKMEIQQIIQRNLQQAHTNILQADELYSEAESLLLEELNLKDYEPDTQYIAEISLSQMMQAGRMDAEYFQPKYAQFVEYLKSYKNGSIKLEELVSFPKTYEVGAKAYLSEQEKTKESVQFVRAGEISPFELKKKKYISEDLYNELGKEYQPEKDEILLTKNAIPGIAHHLSEKPQKMIVSIGLVRLQPKTQLLNTETLTLILNSKIVKEQINRDIYGTIFKLWAPGQIKATLIPLIPQSLQEEISQKIQKSHQLRVKSKRLLEVAKIAVEIAIEKGESEAIKWINENSIQ